MKKTAALLMLSSIAYSKDFNIKFKSDTEYMVNSKEYIYRPVDLKIFSKDNKYGYFLKIRGTSEKFALYDDEIVPIDMDTVRINDEVKKGNPPVPKKYSDILPTYNSAHYHGPHEHDEALDEHDHFFDDIVHEHDPNVLNLERYRFFKFKEYSNKFQVKFGAFYNPTKYSQIRFAYMPLTYDSDERKYFNALVLDGKYTHFFNDNFALIVRPKFATEKLYKPSFVELKTDLRYKLDDNTFLSAYMYNGLQLKDMKNKELFLNSIQLTYDYNTEKRRAHKFYEILDHEHEKIDQTKLSVRFAHESRNIKNPLDKAKLKYDHKQDTYVTNIKFDFKKTIEKDFIVEHEFKLDNTVVKNVDSNRKYFEKRVLLDQKGELKQNNVDDETLYTYFTNTLDSYKKDLSEFYREYESNGYKVIATGNSKNGDKYLAPEISRETETLNRTKVKYKNFEVENKLTTKSVKGYNYFLLADTLRMSYNKKLGYGFSVKPYVEGYYHPAINEMLDIPLQFGYLGFGVDANYKYRNANLRVDLGVIPEFDILTRKADISVVEAEKGKWVFGSQLKLKPYAKVRYKFENNIELFAKTEFDFSFSKDTNNSGNDGLQVENSFKFKGYTGILNAGIKYSW